VRFGKKGKPVELNDMESDHPSRQYPPAGDHGIAGKAHGFVYGERAKTYGHPRKDFTIIAKVWTGLLQDLLQDGAELDPYRVAVMMTGLKLARLVKSPGHHDSRVDTIGYMLTMERLDEPTEEELLKADAACVADDDLDDELPTAARLKPYTFPAESPDDPHIFSQKTIWAYTYKEAQEQFDQWNEGGRREPNHDPLDFTKGEYSGPVTPREPDMSSRNSGQDPNPLYSGPKFGTPEFDAKFTEVAAEQAKDWPKVPEDDLVNPSDQDVDTAWAIINKRQKFHDREARKLLTRGDGIGLGPQ
jgi:hypothetical protein